MRKKWEKDSSGVTSFLFFSCVLNVRCKKKKKEKQNENELMFKYAFMILSGWCALLVHVDVADDNDDDYMMISSKRFTHVEQTAEQKAKLTKCEYAAVM